MKTALLVLLLPLTAGAQIERFDSPNGGPISPTSVSATSGTFTGSGCATNDTIFRVGGSTIVAQCNGKVGIGTNGPAQKIHMSSGTLLVDGSAGQVSVSGDTGTPGSTVKGVIRLQNTGVGVTLGLGAFAGSPFGTWLQSIDANSGSATTYPLSIQPIGGNVGIGTTAPVDKLHISSGVITIDGTGSPTKNSALCLTTAGKLGACDGLVGADGTCTCTSP